MAETEEFIDDANSCPSKEIKSRLFNGFNNGRDPSDGVGGRPAENYYQPIVDHSAPDLLTDAKVLLTLPEIEKRIIALEKRVHELENPYIPGMHP